MCERKKINPQMAEVLARLLRSQGGNTGHKSEGDLSQRITESLGTPDWMNQTEEGDEVIATAMLLLHNLENSTQGKT